MSDGFLGRGWRFPILPDRTGGLGYVGGEANIEQSLVVLLQTAHGERVMRQRFGTRARDLVFSPGSPQNLRLLEGTVREAVRDFEPRVDVDSVRAELDQADPSRAVVELTYRVRQTNTRQNLVFPFYLGLLETP